MRVTTTAAQVDRGRRLEKLPRVIDWIRERRAGALAGARVTAGGRTFVVAARPSGKIA